MTERTPHTTAPLLVPVDFSTNSGLALAWATHTAACVEAPLVVLHVVHDPAEAPGYYLNAQVEQENGGTQPLRRLEDAAAMMMASFLERFDATHSDLPAVPRETRLVSGIPTKRILEVADSIGARLIVMGSQGRTGLSRALLGSKAEQVVRLAQVPVTIVKPTNDED
jgi:nucleotide-binding universal stress UspA family protein